MVEFQVGSPDWSAQTTWYIDAATGDDGAVGDAGNPLATFGEFQRRMRGQILNTDYTVYITGNQAELPVDFDIGVNGYLDIIFAVTPGAVYTVNAFTPANILGTAEVEKIQTVELATAAALVGKRLRFLTGPASNCIAWATRALAGYDDHTFEMTRPYSFTKINGTWLKAVPANPNTFIVETLPVVAAVSVHIRRHGGQGFCFAIRNAQFGTLAAPVQDPRFEVEGWGSTVACAWYCNGLQTDGYHVSDGFLKGSVMRGLATPIDKARFIGCYLTGNFLLSDLVIWDSLFKHGSVGIESGEVHFVGLVGICIEVADAIQDALWLFGAACRLIVSTNGDPQGYLFSLNATRYALNIPPGAVVNYTATPYMSAGVSYALIGATQKAYGAVPYIEPASNAAMIQGMNAAIG